MHPVYKSFRMALFSIALNANLAGYTTAVVPHRSDSHSLVSSTQVSSVSKILASGSVSLGKRLIASASGTSGVLSSGQALAANQSVTSQNGQYSLVCQSDGNLVLYENSTNSPYWTSQTGGATVRECLMQSDGNLVVYGNSRAVWTSGTPGHTGAYLQVQNDRNVVIYAANGQVLWTTNTSVSNEPVLNYAKNRYFYGTFSALDFQNTITLIVNKGGYIQNIAFTPKGGWVIVYTTIRQDYSAIYSAYYKGIPQEAADELNSLFSSYAGNISDIEFAPQGGFIILYNNGEYYISNDAPQSLANKFKAVYDSSGIPATISRIVFTPQGGIILLDNLNTIYYSTDIPQSLVTQLTAIHNVGSDIESLAITPQGGLLAIIRGVNTAYYYTNIPQSLANQIQTLKPKVAGVHNVVGVAIPIIAFTPGGDWVLIAYLNKSTASLF